jgi:hypothetical protein
VSRRKDRERVEAMRGLNPDYKGFRGHGSEPSRSGNAPLEAVTCSVCGRKRNVPRGVAIAQGDAYVCSRCADQAAETTVDTGAGDEADKKQSP